MYLPIKKMVFLFIMYLTLSACNSNPSEVSDNSSNNPSDNNSYETELIGFNINWSFLPDLNEDIVGATVSLNPDIIRYPGGSVSKTWDWETGTTSKSPNRPAHTLDDLFTLKDATSAEVVFVLNTITRDLDNQLELLRTAQGMGISINYIEMGNEHYLGKGNNSDDAGNHQDNVEAFPTGKEYAEFVNDWAPRIKAEFPNAKIGISMLGRTNKNERLQTWNQLIVENIIPENFDAYVYHIYVRPDNDIELNDENIAEIIQERTDVLESVMIDDDSKKVWITEYGVHADTLESTVILTSALADYVESIADISMPQVLYTKSDKTFFSLLASPDADYLTELGEMFSERQN